MNEDFNAKYVWTLDFMNRYGGYEFTIENGRVTKVSPAPASNQDSHNLTFI